GGGGGGGGGGEGRGGPGKRPRGGGGKGAGEMGRGGYPRDEVDRLAGPPRVRGQIAVRHGLAISLRGAGVGRKLAFPAPPLVEEGSAEGAGRILRRPRRFPGDVGHPAALGVLPAAFDDRLGDRGRNQSLGRSQEPGPEQRPGGAQGQRGRKTPAVGDAAGGQHRHG